MKESDLMFGAVNVPEGVKVVVHCAPDELIRLIRTMMFDKVAFAEIFFTAVMSFVTDSAKVEDIQDLAETLIDEVKQKEKMKSKTQDEIAREFLEKSPQVKAIINALEKQANGIKS